METATREIDAPDENGVTLADEAVTREMEEANDRGEPIPGGWQPGDDPEMMPSGMSQLSLDIGGEPPTASVLKFSGSTDLQGFELKKGSRHRFEIEVRIEAEGAKDSYDKHGNLKATTKEQTGAILSAERIGG